MIKPATSLRNLGVWFDQLMTMSNRFGKVCSKAFYSLYNQRHMRKCLTDEACETLEHALVVCHFDFCKALLHDVSQYQQQSLQRVLNAVAWLICRLPKYYHISPVLKRPSLAIDKTSRDLQDHSASFSARSGAIPKLPINNIHKKISTEFEPVPSAIPVRCSTN